MAFRKLRKMKLYFVRHGKTKGNEEGRYVGRTDEPVLDIALSELKKKEVPMVERVIVSPMLRCRQTGEVLYPGIEMYVCQGLQEMDFGDFEYKNYQELDGNQDYQAYIDSGGQTGFPGGESLEDFKKRCVKAFEEMIEKAEKEKISSMAFVVHGGTIMAILEAYGEPARSYFEWQLKNGQWLSGEYNNTRKIYIDR